MPKTILDLNDLQAEVDDNVVFDLNAPPGRVVFDLNNPDSEQQDAPTATPDEAPVSQFGTGGAPRKPEPEGFLRGTAGEIGKSLLRETARVGRSIAGTVPKMLDALEDKAVEVIDPFLQNIDLGSIQDPPGEQNINERIAEAADEFYLPIINDPDLAPDPDVANATYTGAIVSGDVKLFAKKLFSESAGIAPSMATTIAGFVLGGPVGAGVAGGALEGASQFEEALESGEDPEEALRQAGVVGLGTGFLNAIPFARPLHGILPKSTAGKAMGLILDAVSEGATETAEGGLGPIAELKEIPKTTEGVKQLLVDIGRGVYDESGVFLPAALTGGGISAGSAFRNRKSIAASRIDRQVLIDDITDDIEGAIRRARAGALAQDIDISGQELSSIPVSDEVNSELVKQAVAEVAKQSDREPSTNAVLSGETKLDLGLEATELLDSLPDSSTEPSEARQQAEQVLSFRDPEQRIFESREPIPSGFGEGVFNRGPSFAAEVMEAGRRLGVTPRFKNLGPSTLGLLDGFIRNDRLFAKIFLADVRNTRTMAHEVGHAVDFTAFRNVAKGATLQSRLEITHIDEETLLDELKEISFGIARPFTEQEQTILDFNEQNGDTSFIEYRNSASELFADFFSLYVHDQALARKTAPLFTAAFEQKIEQDAAINELVTQLALGTVEPFIPEHQTQTAQVTIDGPTNRDDRANLAETKKEPAAMQAAQDLVKLSVRTRAAEIAVAFKIAQKWSKSLNESELNDVGAAVEGIPNLSRKGDTIQKLKERLSPEQKKVLKEYRFRVEESRQEINKYLEPTGEAEYLQFIDDYLAHFYANSRKRLQGARNRFLKNSPNAKKRKLPTLAEGVELGLNPITQNVSTLFRMWNEINWRVATNRRFLFELREIRTADGDRVLMPSSKAPPDWPRIDHHAIKQTFAVKTDDNSKLLVSGEAAVHPDVVRAVNMMLNRVFTGRWVNAIETINAFSKKSMLSFSLFHHLALTESSQNVSLRFKNPLRGIVLLNEDGAAVDFPFRKGLKFMENEEFLRDSIMSGLILPAPSDINVNRVARELARMEANTRGIPVLGKAAKRARQFNETWDHVLWDVYFGGTKAFEYYDLVQEFLERKPNTTVQEIQNEKEQIASHINNSIGGQEWETKFWLDPKVRQVAHWVTLAPDWTWSNIQVLGDVVRPGISHEQRRRSLRYWRNTAISLTMAHTAMQFAPFVLLGDDDEGDKPFPWQNEIGQRTAVDVTPIIRQLGWKESGNGQRYYVNPGKQAKELLRWATEPFQTAFQKSSPLVHVTVEQVLGVQSIGFEADWVREEKEGLEQLGPRAIALARSITPLSLKGGNFAMTLPMRKGMTPWKLHAGLTKALSTYADPSIFDGLQDSPDYVGKLDDIVGELLDAGRLNGISVDRSLSNAIGEVRGKFYRDFLEAVEENDESGMEQGALSITRMHAGFQNVMRSAKARGIELTREQQQQIARELGIARRELAR